jgi:type II secretory pathway pseudopilin PulG
MRILCPKRLEHGTTLPEVLTASAILAISIAAIMTAVFSGFLVVERLRENQRATQVILEKLETLRLYSWTQVNTSGFIPEKFSEPYDPQAPNGAKGITYQGSIAIEPFPHNASYKDEMRQVTVTLRWTSKGNLERSRTFVTYIAKDGVQNYVY